MDLKVSLLFIYLLANVYLPDAILSSVILGACVTVITQQNLCLFEDYILVEKLNSDQLTR